MIKLTASSPDEEVPHLMNMLKYYCSEMAIAKSLTASIANGTLAPRYIRPAELQHQEEIQDYMKNSQQFLLPLNGACLLPGTLPFLDCVTHRMA
uniref:DNA-directed RNA polymerase n=1 Tax=Heterorhabditis bacteriophora TaxID=37862 RepID=A0A1I7XPD6_HETBA